MLARYAQQRLSDITLISPLCSHNRIKSRKYHSVGNTKDLVLTPVSRAINLLTFGVALGDTCEDRLDEKYDNRMRFAGSLHRSPAPVVAFKFVDGRAGILSNRGPRPGFVRMPGLRARRIQEDTAVGRRS